MEFGGCDMVLGAQWLQILGPILWGFSKMWMPFKSNSLEFTINAMISFKISSTGSSCALLYMCQQVDTGKFKKDDRALLPPIDKFYSLIQEATFSCSSPLCRSNGLAFYKFSTLPAGWAVMILAWFLNFKFKIVSVSVPTIY
eukprot:TRINITY_DN22061_c0_g1_i1.p1 TRINITY_DN22061_c0_g1~~TRINITY_DN22061_c0_g1_i1.p1  ORF type:complete len:142 (-),score=8.42 TRINITY_DN22061_c0_g1_i1:515-940(-)